MDGFTACPASGEGIAPSTDSALALDFLLHPQKRG
ncbi:hypothetical protein FHR50_003728 [Xanthomonas arboricola]